MTPFQSIMQIPVMFGIIGLMIYGICYMIGGPALANRFAARVRRVLYLIVRAIGRSAGRLALRHPFAAGILMLLTFLLFLLQQGKP